MQMGLFMEIEGTSYFILTSENMMEEPTRFFFLCLRYEILEIS